MNLHHNLTSSSLSIGSSIISTHPVNLFFHITSKHSCKIWPILRQFTHKHTQLEITPPEEGVRDTHSTGSLTGNPGQNEVGRPTAGPLFPCQWSGTEQLCSDQKNLGHLLPAPHDTGTFKVGSSAEKQPHFTLFKHTQNRVPLQRV